MTLVAVKLSVLSRRNLATSLMTASLIFLPVCVIFTHFLELNTQ